MEVRSTDGQRPGVLFAIGSTDPGYFLRLSAGALYWFKSQGCVVGAHNWATGDYCKFWSYWGPVEVVYAADTGTHWYDTETPGHGPNDGWAAGYEVSNGQFRDLEVCAAEFNAGNNVQSTQVGKFFDSECHFGYGGGEVWQPGAMVLNTIDANVGWAGNNLDGVMQSAVAGGWENGHPLYVCRAWHSDPNDPNNFGWHPGKVVDSSCNIAYGGVEIPVGGYWQVLTH
jgi:hypothetical protein